MKTLMKVALFALAFSLSAVTLADNHSTLRVVTVATDDVDAYIVQLRKGKQLMMKVAPKMLMRAWRGTFAGEAAGSIIVSLEYPGSLSDFASAWEKTQGDKDMAAWLDGLSGMRKLVSDSLYQEISI